MSVQASHAAPAGGSPLRPETIFRELSAIVGPRAVLCEPEDLLLYEYDGSVDRATPLAVALPATKEEVIALVKWARDNDVVVVPRGAGTGLSGGAVAIRGGLMIGFARMKRILSIDIENQRAVVQPGVVNLDLSAEVAPAGYYYVPDPSSQKACTLGGNVSENAGGPHTLAYGVTTNHVLGVEMVLPNGQLTRLGGAVWDAPGYDLTGLFVGSEGTLGIVTEITVKLTRQPEAVKTLLAIFDRVDDGSETVAEITSRAITPAALEMMDQITLQAVEDATNAGYPRDAACVLLIELEGLREAVEAQAAQVRELCQRHRARSVRIAQSEGERQKLWAGRKNAFGALGRKAPSFYVQDGVIPRTKIPQTMRFIQDVSDRYGLAIANVFHAGDGNLHPNILFDSRDPVQRRKVVEAGAEILKFCLSLGGSLTGEHGVGMEKSELMAAMFSADDLDVMSRIKAVFNPDGRLNPLKIFPTDKACGEIRIPPQHPF